MHNQQTHHHQLQQDDLQKYNTLMANQKQNNQSRISVAYSNSNCRTINSHHQNGSSQGEQDYIKKTVQEEEKQLYVLYLEYGSKWSLIAEKMSKTPIQVKNKFYGGLRKLLRRLITIGRKVSTTKRQIKYNALIRPFEASNFSEEPYANFFQERQNIKSTILKHLQEGPQKITQKAGQSLLQHIHKFNSQTKSFKFHKHEQVKTSSTKAFFLKSKEQREDKTLKNCEYCLNSQENILINNEMMDFETIEKIYQIKNQAKSQKTLSDFCQCQLYNLHDIMLIN